MLEGGNLRWDRAQHCLTEGSLRSPVLICSCWPLLASFPRNSTVGADASADSAKTLRPIQKKVSGSLLFRYCPGVIPVSSSSHWKKCRILKSNIIGNLRDCVIRVRQLSHCAVHFGFQDELLQCHPGALVEEGGEVFVVVAEITGEFGDFEGLAAVVLDVAMMSCRICVRCVSEV